MKFAGRVYNIDFAISENQAQIAIMGSNIPFLVTRPSLIGILSTALLSSIPVEVDYAYLGNIYEIMDVHFHGPESRKSFSKKVNAKIMVEAEIDSESGDVTRAKYYIP